MDCSLLYRMDPVKSNPVFWYIKQFLSPKGDGFLRGDGIRPSERGKGLGTELVRLALEECQKLGIRRVLMVCSRENPASARTIQKNGGILENELPVDGVIEQRYWITLGPPDAFSGL